MDVYPAYLSLWTSIRPTCHCGRLSGLPVTVDVYPAYLSLWTTIRPTCHYGRPAGVGDGGEDGVDPLGAHPLLLQHVQTSLVAERQQLLVIPTESGAAQTEHSAAPMGL